MDVVLEEGNTVEHVATDDVAVCASKCDMNEKCKSFTVGGGGCWLKDKCLTGSEPSVQNGYKTAYKPDDICLPNGWFMMNVVVEEGNTIEHVATDDAAVCASKCDMNEKCKSFSFGIGGCWLKDKCLTGSEASVQNGYKTAYKPDAVCLPDGWFMMDVVADEGNTVEHVASG